MWIKLYINDCLLTFPSGQVPVFPITNRTPSNYSWIHDHPATEISPNVQIVVATWLNSGNRIWEMMCVPSSSYLKDINISSGFFPLSQWLGLRNTWNSCLGVNNGSHKLSKANAPTRKRMYSRRILECCGVMSCLALYHCSNMHCSSWVIYFVCYTLNLV